MPAEALHQFDMFTRELVDTRTDKQRQQDHERSLPQQTLMFPQSAIAQIGVTAHPKMRWEGATTLEPLQLIQEDTRSDEEKAIEQLRAEQALITPMFPATPTDETHEEDATDEDDDEPIPEQDYFPDSDPQVGQAEALNALMTACEDIINTVAAAPEIIRAQAVLLATTTMEARSAGVSQELIDRLLETAKNREPILLQPNSARFVRPNLAVERRRRSASNQASHYPTSRTSIRRNTVYAHSLSI